MRVRRQTRFAAVGLFLLLTGTGVLIALEENLLKVFLLRNYNTRLVVLSTTLLGISSGMVGSFLLLRRRSLMGDALSHATLPGIALAFMGLVALGGVGKELGWLLGGAALSGLLGVVAVTLICRLPRMKEDTAMGIVLSVFYGAGVALLGLIQEMPGAGAAGLETFIYGKTASLVGSDFQILWLITGGVVLVSAAFYKEFKILCFDEAFAASTGWPVRRLDLLLLGLVTAVTVAGLQAVGLILIIALLVIPPAAARMWTSRLYRMLILSGLIGGMSGWIGATLSALLSKLPAGAVIVLVASGFFLFSLFLGTERGILVRLLRHLSLKRRVERQNLLRAFYEVLEQRAGGRSPEAFVSWQELLARRSWSPRLLYRIARRALEAELIEEMDRSGLLLSPEGLAAAAKVTRNHRLWELYLIEHADIAPNHVDRDADFVEHVLGERLTRHLEQSLPDILRTGAPAVPGSPHGL
ncbi:MAG: iron chelate uptake ABC transporter family permease subunit [Oceanipulchritudo sp.]